MTGHREVVRRYDLTPAGFHAGVSGVEPRTEQIRRAQITLLLGIDLDGDERGLDTKQIAAKLETSQLMIEQHLARLLAQRFVSYTTTFGGHSLTHVSPELARELE